MAPSSARNPALFDAPWDASTQSVCREVQLRTPLTPITLQKPTTSTPYGPRADIDGLPKITVTFERARFPKFRNNPRLHKDQIASETTINLAETKGARAPSAAPTPVSRIFLAAYIGFLICFALLYCAANGSPPASARQNKSQ